ncbi:hypothetical protein [Streptomyces pseudogriseolus]|uniref:hypothetical protein n=1 Tax=Streptomyces pseudogriseolus TaxID=36817 RepID=UPI003FA2A9C0
MPCTFSRFSRSDRRPTSPDLVPAWTCLDSDDVPGALRPLRQAGTAPLAEVALEQLRERVPGQVLHEHASCWTDPPPVATDRVTFLNQSVVARWAGGPRQGADGGVEWGEADARAGEEIAAAVVGADPELDEGDGRTPADPVEGPAPFVAVVRDA